MAAMQDAGYYTGLYASREWLENKVDGSQLAEYDKWVAAYRRDLPEPGKAASGYDGAHGMWQYTVIGTTGTKGKHYWTYGSVPGVPGNCDLNTAYKDYPAIIRAAGMNHLGDVNKMITISADEYAVLLDKADRYDRITALVAK